MPSLIVRNNNADNRLNNIKENLFDKNNVFIGFFYLQKEFHFFIVDKNLVFSTDFKRNKNEKIMWFLSIYYHRHLFVI